MEYTTESLTELIFGVINNIFSKLFNSIDNTVYSMLDEITFIDKDILKQKNFTKIFGADNTSGVLLIANSLLLGFFIYYAFSYLLSHLTLKQIQRPGQFFFKAIIFIAIMNSSLWFCEEIINIVSLITKSLNALCEDVFNTQISFTSFLNMLNQSLDRNDLTFDLFSFNGIIKTFTSIGILNLILTYSLRYVLIQVFVIICPFAILSLLNESSERLFKVWLKNFLMLLFVQVLLSIMLMLAFSFDSIGNKLLQKLLFVAIIYAVSRTNHFMKEIVGGITFDVKQNIGVIR
jgi:hypothetical protein